MRVFKHIKHIFFTGIGGIGMSGLADILIESGYQVSGSDRALSDITDYLKSRGADIYQGHDKTNLVNVDALVYSSAVPENNPERVYARENGILQIRRAEMLAEVMRLKYGIAVAGTHGKTTTTSMCAEILLNAGLDPTIVVGGRFKDSLTNAHLGKGDFFVTEADEYDRSFLTLSPVFSIITSIEADHLDIYKDLDDIYRTFVEFAQKTAFYGRLIVCDDDPGINKIRPELPANTVSYGMNNSADYYATDVRYAREKSYFIMNFHDQELGAVQLNVPGEHNIKNAVAAAIVGLELEIPFKTIQSALGAYTGVERRFDIKARVGDILIVDDYAHHPTEVRATIQSARQAYDNRIIAVFQPHLFSRTRDFYKEFAGALDLADVVFLCDIYPAREEPISGVSSRMIFDQLKGKKFYIPQRAQLAEEICRQSQANDLIILMGAGDIWQSAAEIEQKLHSV